MSNDDILQRLSSFIDRKSPQPARFLYRMWADQQKAVTYRELREAILNGGLSINYLLDWQQDYSNFLVESYTPLVEAASKQVVKDLIAEYGVELHDPMYSAIERYISTHGGRLIREVSTAQYQAINVLVRQAAMTDTMTVDQLARAIRPCIGLTKWQCQQTKKFYDNLIEQGYSHKKALKRQMTYAAKMHRQRAALIAETETAYAYNNAAKTVITDAVEQGLVSPEVMKEWTTADDEKVCKRCGAADGEVVPLNELFSIGVDTPPAHPGCRCAVKYLLKMPERQEAAKPQEPEPFSEEWFENGKVSPETYDQISDEMWDNDFEPSNKDVREMVDAVHEYTSANYTDILASEAGYSGRFAQYSQMVMTPEKRSAADKNVERINEFLSMSPKYEGTVYRALGFDVGGDLDQGHWETFRTAYQAGNIVGTDTMSSWTKKKSILNQILANRAGMDETSEYSVEVIMTMKNGKQGVDISRLAELQAQDEVLFPKTKLKVLDYDEEWVDDELLRVWIEVMEVLPN